MCLSTVAGGKLRRLNRPDPPPPPPPFVERFSDLTKIVFHSPAELVSIRRVDEAVVIGAALSLSSSAFVLKILQVHQTQR